MARKRKLEGTRKYKISPETNGGWTIYEWRCSNKSTNTWGWVSVKHPSSLKRAMRGLIELHLNPDIELGFELTYPNNFKSKDAPMQVQLNVSVDDLERLHTHFNAIHEDLTNKLEEIVHGY